MLNLLTKDKKFGLLKVCVICVLLFSFSGCRQLSDSLNPDGATGSEKMTKVNRKKPNSSETAKLDVDPDSDELVEEPLTKEEEKIDVSENKEKPKDETPNKDANSNTSDKEKPDASESSAELKAKNLVGKWEGKLEGVPLVFEFGEAKKEGENFTGVTKVLMDNEPQPSIKYVIAKDGKVTFIDGKETEEVNVEISSDGNSMKFTNSDKQVLNLKRVKASN